MIPALLRPPKLWVRLFFYDLATDVVNGARFESSDRNFFFVTVILSVQTERDSFSGLIMDVYAMFAEMEFA